MAVQTSVLVAEAQPLLREGLVSLTREALKNVRVTECADLGGLASALIERPDAALALIDLELPGVVDLSSVVQMREDFPKTKIALTSNVLNRDMALSALAAGFHGYVLKSGTRDELLFAIKSVSEGHLYYPTDLAEQGRYEGFNSPTSVLLSSRQLEILELLACGMANKEIARRLNIAEGTVKVHLNAAFRALGVHNRAGAVSALHDLAHRTHGGATSDPRMRPHPR